MASSIPPVLVQLVADVSQLKAGMAQAEASLKGLDKTVATTSGKMNSFVGNLKKVGAAMGATFAATQLVSFAKESIMAASNTAEAISKVGVVFEENSKEIETWAAGATANFGMSERGALTAVGTFGNLFDAFGLGEGETKKFSTSLTELAVDMASFNDMPVDDALNALRSGLSGETEPMKKFGSVLSETRLKTEALSLGLIKNTKQALDPAAKAQAAYALIMKDTAKQQGDYDRTAGGTANTMRRVAAEMDNAKVAIGQGLLPVFNALLKVMEFGIVPVLKAVGKFLKENSTAVATFGAVLAAGVVVWGVYTLAINAATIATKVWTAVTKANPIGLIIVAVALLAAGIATLWKRSETFRNVVISVAKAALTAFASIIPMVGKVYEVIMKVVTGPLRALLTVLSKLPGVGKYAKAGLDIMNKGLDGISDFADGAAKKANSLIATLDKVGKQASTTADKVDTATTGGNNKNGGGTKLPKLTADEIAKNKEKLNKYKKDVQDIYKDMNKVIADAQDDAAQAMANRDEKIANANKRYSETMADAQVARSRAEAEALKKKTETLDDIEKNYKKKLVDLEKTHQAKLTDLRTTAAQKSIDLTKSAAEKQQSIVQQSMDRLRSAFASKTSFSISDALGGGKSADSLLADLKAKLQAAKNLQADAAALAGMGYSQVFIEQIVSQGPQIGGEMAKALKDASPETNKEIQSLFLEVDNISNHGMDQLATTMNAGANLATQELKDAYDQVAKDLKISLSEINADLTKALAEENAVYQEAMNEAKASRDDAMADAVKSYTETMAEIKQRFDDILIDATKTLQESLIDAQNDYQKAIAAIAKTTKEKIDELKIQLAEVAALMAKLGADKAAAAALANAPKYTTISPVPNLKNGSQNGFSAGGNGTPGTTFNTTVNATTNANPASIANTVTQEIKFGTAVVTLPKGQGFF
jgi:hypothetical protein